MAKQSKFISVKWNRNLAYAIGLFTTDGCLSSDGRHLEFCSKDKEQVENFKKCLGLTNKITKKSRANEKIKKYYRVQFGSIQFYKFLQSIDLCQRKSYLLQKLKIRRKYFRDFLRGVFDGDGTIDCFFHPESQYPQLKIKFSSASPRFLNWLQKEINKNLHTRGYITENTRAQNLEYGKSDSQKILKFMYYPPFICLTRKFEKAKKFLILKKPRW